MFGPRLGRLRLLGVALELLELHANVLELLRAALEHGPGLAGGDRLDAPGAGADRAFAQDQERADLRGRADVGAAAELGRVVADLDDAHLVAVLLAEQHHRAELASLFDRRHVRAHRDRLEHLLVDEALDALALLRRQLVLVREVEAQLVGPHGGARLLDMVAEHVAQRLVRADAWRCGWPASGSGRPS